MIDHGDLPTMPEDKSLHQRAVSPSNYNLLQSLGVDAASLVAAPYRHMSVWDAVSHGAIDFSAPISAQNALGYIIDMQELRYQLYDHIKTQARIELLTQATCRHRIYTGKTNTLHLRDGKIISAKLVVGADGANSWLRQQANIAWSGHSYHQHALVANVRCEKAHQQTAYQCFLNDGPLAFLPLSDPYQCAIVWTGGDEKMHRLRQLDEATFNPILTDAFQHRLGKVTTISQRATFPLRMYHAAHYVQPGLALAGDAAHIIHPMAGLGLNLGLLDVAYLAKQLKKAMQQSKNIGDYTVLRPYERYRYSENKQALLFINELKQAFCHGDSYKRKLCAYGFNLINRCPPIKHYFIDLAI